MGASADDLVNWRRFMEDFSVGGIELVCSGWLTEAYVFVDPLDEIFHVGGVGVAAIILTPGELPTQEAIVDRGHLGGAVVAVDAEAFGAEQGEDGTCGNGGHVTASLIEPLGIALFRNAVADECEPRRAERNQFV